MASDKQTNWEPDSVHLVVSRSDVETANTEEILRALNKINSSKESALRFRGAVDLAVHGYNNDARELFEIPEVRSYYELLTEQFPYWFFFLNLQLSTLRVIASCLCGARLVSNGKIKIDNVKLAAFMKKQFFGLNSLFEEYDLDNDYPDLNREMSEKIIEYFEL